MKRIFFIMVAVIALTIPLATSANNGHKKNKVVVDPTFVCASNVCTYSLSGLTPSTSEFAGSDWVAASISFKGSDGKGCNVGMSAIPVQSDGTAVFSLSESFMKCGSISSGMVTAWARAGNSTLFDDPALPGTLITTTVS